MSICQPPFRVNDLCLALGWELKVLAPATVKFRANFPVKNGEFPVDFHDQVAQTCAQRFCERDEKRRPKDAFFAKTSEAIRKGELCLPDDREKIIDLLAKLFCVQEWNKRNNNRTPTKRGLAFPRLMETKPRSHNIEGLDFLGLGNPNPTLKRKISETDEKASDNLRSEKLSASMRDHCSRVLSVMRESHYQPNDIRGDIKICDSKYPSVSWLFSGGRWPEEPRCYIWGCMHEIGIYPLKDPDQDDILSLTNRLIKFLNLIRSEVQYESAVTKVRTFVTIWSNRWLNCGLGWLETISQDRCIRTAAFDAIWQAKEARSNDRKISIILRTNEVATKGPESTRAHFEKRHINKKPKLKQDNDNFEEIPSPRTTKVTRGLMNQEHNNFSDMLEDPAPGLAEDSDTIVVYVPDQSPEAQSPRRRKAHNIPLSPKTPNPVRDQVQVAAAALKELEEGYLGMDLSSQNIPGLATSLVQPLGGISKNSETQTLTGPLHIDSAKILTFNDLKPPDNRISTPKPTPNLNGDVDDPEWTGNIAVGTDEVSSPVDVLPLDGILTPDESISFTDNLPFDEVLSPTRSKTSMDTENAAVTTDPEKFQDSPMDEAKHANGGLEYQLQESQRRLSPEELQEPQETRQLEEHEEHQHEAQDTKASRERSPHMPTVLVGDLWNGRQVFQEKVLASKTFISPLSIVGGKNDEPERRTNFIKDHAAIFSVTNSILQMIENVAMNKKIPEENANAKKLALPSLSGVSDADADASGDEPELVAPVEYEESMPELAMSQTQIDDTTSAGPAITESAISERAQSSLPSQLTIRKHPDEAVNSKSVNEEATYPWTMENRAPVPSMTHSVSASEPPITQPPKTGPADIEIRNINPDSTTGKRASSNDLSTSWLHVDDVPKKNPFNIETSDLSSVDHCASTPSLLPASVPSFAVHFPRSCELDACRGFQSEEKDEIPPGSSFTGNHDSPRPPPPLPGAVANSTKYLTTLPEKYSRHCKDLLALPIVRKINYRRPDQVVTGLDRGKEKLESVLAQQRGKAMSGDSQCAHCRNGLGKFKECVVVTGKFGGACANCLTGRRRARCSFRTTSTKSSSAPCRPFLNNTIESMSQTHGDGSSKRSENDMENLDRRPFDDKLGLTLSVSASPQHLEAHRETGPLCTDLFDNRAAQFSKCTSSLHKGPSTGPNFIEIPTLNGTRVSPSSQTTWLPQVNEVPNSKSIDNEGNEPDVLDSRAPASQQASRDQEIFRITLPDIGLRNSSYTVDRAPISSLLTPPPPLNEFLKASPIHIESPRSSSTGTQVSPTIPSASPLRLDNILNTSALDIEAPNRPCISTSAFQMTSGSGNPSQLYSIVDPGSRIVASPLSLPWVEDVPKINLGDVEIRPIPSIEDQVSSRISHVGEGKGPGAKSPDVEAPNPPNRPSSTSPLQGNGVPKVNPSDIEGPTLISTGKRASMPPVSTSCTQSEEVLRTDFQDMTAPNPLAPISGPIALPLSDTVGPKITFVIENSKRQLQFDPELLLPSHEFRDSTLAGFFALYSERSGVELGRLEKLTFILIFHENTKLEIKRIGSSEHDWKTLKKRISSFFKMARAEDPDEVDFEVWIRVGDVIVSKPKNDEDDLAGL